MLRLQVYRPFGAKFELDKENPSQVTSTLCMIHASTKFTCSMPVLHALHNLFG